VLEVVVEYRKVHVPNAEVVRAVVDDWNRLADKKLPIHRHTIMLNLWELLKHTDGQIPVGIEAPVDILKADIPYFTEYTAAAMKELGLDRMDVDPNAAVSDEKFKEALLRLRSDLSCLWLRMKTVEVSDTPNWYRIPEDLAYALAATDLKGVYANDIKLPFPAIYIELPDGVIQIEEGSESAHVRCLGIGIADLDRTDAGHTGYWTGLVIAAFYQTSDGELDTFCDHFNLPNGGSTVDQAAIEARARLSDLDFGDLTVRVFGRPETTISTSTRAFNLIFGYLLYLQQHRAILIRVPDKKVKGKQRPAKVAKAGAKKILSANSWISGTSCKIDPEVKEAIRGGWSVSRTHSSVVAGHYRRYRVGPRDDWTYEVKWIKPHKRGSKGPILGHSYEGGKGG
jgi:hypothetical protein